MNIKKYTLFSKENITDYMITKMMEEPELSPKEKIEMEKFLTDFLRYSEWFEREKEKPDGSWGWEFISWLIKKINSNYEE